MRIRIMGAAAAVLALAACGGGSQQSPQQVLLTAAHFVSTTSLQMDLTASETINVDGPAAAEFSSLAGRPITLSGHFEAAGTHLARGTLTLSLAGQTQAVDLVEANGTAYVSSDGGQTWKTEDISQLSASEDGVNSAVMYLNAIGTVTDEGAGSADGVSGEKYHATLDPKKMTQLVQSMFSSLGSTLGANLSNALSFNGGTLDALVDGSDRLVTENGTFSAAVNLGAISASLTGNTMSLDASFSSHLYDYGATVTVTPPPSAG
jgi:hypothetical protein